MYIRDKRTWRYVVSRDESVLVVLSFQQVNVVTTVDKNWKSVFYLNVVRK